MVFLRMNEKTREIHLQVCSEAHYSGVSEAQGVVQKKSRFYGLAFGLRLPVQREVWPKHREVHTVTKRWG